MKQEWNKKTLWVLALAILFFMGGVAFYLFSQHNHHSMGSQNKNQHHAQHLKHHEISRLVENIPNGIITVTETDNEELRSSIIDHITLMVTRLQEEKTLR